MDEATRLRKALEEHLNSHGYGFQYAVFAEVVRLFDPYSNDGSVGECRSLSFGRSQSRTLSRRHHSSTLPRAILLVGECKRVNPAFSDWCFLRALTKYPVHSPPGYWWRNWPMACPHLNLFAG